MVSLGDFFYTIITFPIVFVGVLLLIIGTAIAIPSLYIILNMRPEWEAVFRNLPDFLKGVADKENDREE